MTFIAPFNQNNFMGNFESNSNALSFIRSARWDNSKNGFGLPESGMFFFDTVLKRLKYWDGIAWKTLSIGVQWFSALDQLNDPPLAPVLNGSYLIDTVPTGEWIGHANAIALWDGANYSYTEAVEGMTCWVADVDLSYIFNGTEWINLPSTQKHNELLEIQGGASGEYYHLTSDQFDDLTDGGISDSHVHTLDQVYDADGSGLGRSVTVDSGAVAFIVPIANTGMALSCSALNPASSDASVEILNDTLGSSLELSGTNRVINSTTDDLLVSTTTSGDINIESAEKLQISDGYRSGSIYGNNLPLSNATSEWNDFQLQYGNSSLLNAINQRGISETVADMDIYLATTGDDNTGDGTIANPYATFDKSLSVIPKNIYHRVRIIPDAGTYNSFPELNFYNFNENGELIIDATFSLPVIYMTGLSVNDYQPVTELMSGYYLSNDIIVTGTPFTKDTLINKFVRFTSGLLNGYILPIWSNEVDSVRIGIDSYGIVNGDTFDIVTCPVIVSAMNSIRFDSGLIENAIYGATYFNKIYIAGVSFEINEEYNFFEISNSNVVINFAQIKHDISVSQHTVFNVSNSNINAFPAYNPVFNISELDDIFQFGFQILLEDDSWTSNSDLNRSVLCDNSYITGLQVRGSVWTLGASISVQYSMLGAIESQNISDASLYYVYLESRSTLGGSFYAISSKLSHYSVTYVWIETSGSAIHARDNSSFRLDYLKCRPGGLSEDYAITLYNGVQIRLSPVFVDVVAVIGAISFIYGNQHKHLTLPLAGEWYTDEAGSFIIGVGTNIIEYTNTLDNAYHGGIPDAGRTINADLGAVEILVPNDESNGSLYCEIANTASTEPGIEIKNLGLGDSIELSGTNRTISSTGSNLTLKTDTSGQLNIYSAGNLSLKDSYKAASTYSGDLLFSSNASEWSAFETKFGEVSLLNAINQGGTGGSGGVTLDGAYDYGGSGIGRTITVDSGAVNLNAPLSTTSGALTCQILNTASTASVVNLTNNGLGPSLSLDGTRRIISSANSDLYIMTSGTGNLLLSGNNGVSISGPGSIGITSSANSFFTVNSSSLTLSTATSGDLSLSAAGFLKFRDGYKLLSSYVGEFKFSNDTSEWNTYVSNYGQVSLLNAINQAYGGGGGGVTLNGAYNYGGSGSGNTITIVNSKPVTLSNSTAATSTLLFDGTRKWIESTGELNLKVPNGQYYAFNVGVDYKLYINTLGIMVNNGGITLPNTDPNYYGIIYKNGGGDTFLHDFNYGNNGIITTDGYNLFLGKNAGNLHMGNSATQVYYSSYNIGLGGRSLRSNTLGYRNVAVGYNTLSSNTTGAYNVSVGHESLLSNTTGLFNVSIGSSALKNCTAGSGNIAIGANSLLDSLTSTFNIAIGDSALYANAAGTGNVAIGTAALRYSTASNLIAIGSSALYSNTTGTYNIAIGFEGLKTNTSGYSNIALGIGSLKQNTTGFENISIGNSSLGLNTTGNTNIVIGTNSLAANTTGYNNIGIGNTCLVYNTTGNTNIAIGKNSMFYSTTSSFNIAIGENGLRRITTGIKNISAGYDSLSILTVGESNVGIGYSTLTKITNQNDNVAVGSYAGFSAAGNSNCAIGFQALYSDAVSTGVCNTAIGRTSLFKNKSGSFNLAAGFEPSYENIAGSYNVSLGYQPSRYNIDGSNNIAIGSFALGRNQVGNYNIAIGSSSGAYNISGLNNTTCSSNIYIGNDTKSLTASDTNQVVIGKEAIGKGSNTIVLGSSTLTTGTYLSGAVGIGDVNLSGSFTSSLTLKNGTATSIAGQISLYSVAAADGSSTLGLILPKAVESGSFTANRRQEVKIGYTKYYILMST